MKKTFNLIHPTIKVDRVVESVRRDINKYIKRERKRTLPEGSDFWDFDCKFGPSAEEAKIIHLSEISKFISDAEEKQLDSIYVEIFAKPGHRTKKDSIE